MRILLICFLFVMTLETHAQRKKDFNYFIYDKPDQIVDATLLNNPLYYDPSIAATKDGFLLAWLEFVPGEGDHLWVGQRKDLTNGSWTFQKRLSTKPGEFARPTVTLDSSGTLWITYEAAQAANWDIFFQKQQTDGHFTEPQKISSSPGPDINHKAVADAKGGLWVVWQSDQKGQFDVLARHISSGKNSSITTVSQSPLGDWQPSATITFEDALVVIWDSYDGNSYNVCARSFRKGSWSALETIAGSAAFEGRSQIASDQNGVLWALWEEDGENWGKRYVSQWNKGSEDRVLGDTAGPLHRFRRLHLAKLDSKSLKPLKKIEIPQPSLEQASSRTNRRPDVVHLGAFYERGQLAVDSQNRLWVIYSHFYTPWMGVDPHHHVEDDWGIYARCLMPDGWSDLLRMSAGQGDAMQRLSVVPTQRGLAFTWTTGRTDRNKNERPRGVALAEIKLENKPAANPPSRLQPTAPQPAFRPPQPKSQRPVAKANGKSFQLFFGDLHRHTDLSLCFSPSDGTIEDAYRYASDAAPLDFLAITDHTHDLEMGEPLSHLWWRSRKEADRHQLLNTFIPFYSYERSRGDTDHNVITLRPDRMKPHTYPLPRFWDEIDSDTITIPHEPFNRALWNTRNDERRPVLEIYQGFRNATAEDDANEGLLKGHRIGIIASSDHLSTSASFAGVWAEEPTRESLFRAIQARRTFGATAKIALQFTCGNQWMGERVVTSKTPVFRVEVHPTAAIREITAFVNGQPKVLKANTGASKQVHEFALPELRDSTETRFVYIRVTQADGNRAWSSPIWLEPVTK